VNYCPTCAEKIAWQLWENGYDYGSMAMRAIAWDKSIDEVIAIVAKEERFTVAHGGNT
jgi:hypothetical protein